MSVEEKSNANIEINTSQGSSDQVEKNVGIHEETHLEQHQHSAEEIAASGKWYDKRYVPFLPQYSNGMIQTVMLAFCVFMLPGMFNALTGIGAAIDDVTTADHANVALYCTFCAVGFFAGSIVNVVGPKLCLAFGGVGYMIYSGSLLSFLHNRNKGFVIFAGAFLGVCAGCLWAAQTTLMMSYPSESRKGTGIMVFWVIFNLGGVIGSIVPLANNIGNEGSSVNDGTFIAFIILMFCGVCIALTLLPMDKVYRDDGTKVMNQRNMHWKEEIFGVFEVIKKQPIILLLFPMFFASNWFYTYHFNGVNLARFNVRTRSLNSLLYWLSQMVGAGFVGLVLDMKKFKRSTRARIGYAFVVFISFVIWGGGYRFQAEYTRDDMTSGRIALLDFTDSGYGGPVVLYIFYGIFDAIFQTYIFWILGALSNNPKTMALYGGMYKGVQSAGAVIMWSLDSHKVSYMAMFGSSWGLILGSLAVGFPLIFYRISDHTTLEEDNMVDLLDENELKSVKSPVPADL